MGRRRERKERKKREGVEKGKERVSRPVARGGARGAFAPPHRQLRSTFLLKNGVQGAPIAPPEVHFFLIAPPPKKSWLRAWVSAVGRWEGKKERKERKKEKKGRGRERKGEG